MVGESGLPSGPDETASYTAPEPSFWGVQFHTLLPVRYFPRPVGVLLHAGSSSESAKVSVLGKNPAGESPSAFCDGDAKTSGSYFGEPLH